MPKRLNQKEINKIQEEAISNPDYTLENEIRFGKNKTSIIRVSSRSGLILIEGNDKTGFHHISQRHTEPKNLNEWMKEFNNPPNVFSIKKFLDLDFITIADEIFKTENLNTNDNKSIKLYNLYVGSSLYLDKPITYNLLLYKNSKIIHNLFPTENQFNKYPKGFQLYRKLVKSQCDYYNGYFEYEINYFDKEGKNLYKLIFILNIQQFLTAKFISNIDNTNLKIDIPPIKMDMHMGAFLIPAFTHGNLDVYELFLKEYHENNFNNS